MNDLKLWIELFKDVDICGEKDFSNFVKEFNFLLTSEDRHSVLMFMIKKVKIKSSPCNCNRSNCEICR